MLFVKLENGIPVEYPVTYPDLERRYDIPISDLNITFLKSLNFYPVTPKDIPFFDYTKNCKMDMPEYINGEWVESYTVSDKTEEQIKIDTENAKISIRGSRDLLLSRCDWTHVTDCSLSNEKKTEWATYRQALRDVPAQEGYPWNINWPVSPK